MDKSRLYNDRELEIQASALELAAANLRLRASQIDTEQEQFRLRMLSIVASLNLFAVRAR